MWWWWSLSPTCERTGNWKMESLTETVKNLRKGQGRESRSACIISSGNLWLCGGQVDGESRK